MFQEQWESVGSSSSGRQNNNHRNVSSVLLSEWVLRVGVEGGQTEIISMEKGVRVVVEVFPLPGNVLYVEQGILPPSASGPGG